MTDPHALAVLRRQECSFMFRASAVDRCLAGCRRFLWLLPLRCAS